MPIPIPLFQLRTQGCLRVREPHSTAQVANLDTGFTEFYIQGTGNNTNSGSTNSDTPFYTSTNGNWSTTTNQFIPTDGTTPGAAGVRVGDFASVYIDGATVAVYIARIIAMGNGPNSPITLSNIAFIGVAPVTSATTRTIKVGGAWAGPGGASTFPFNLGGNAYNIRNLNGDRTRFNFRNDSSVSMSASMNFGNAGGCTIQGYSQVVGDGGKFLFTNSAAAGIVSSNVVCCIFADVIFENTAVTGTNSLVSLTSSGCIFNRCVFRGSRGSGLTISSNVALNECEFYGNNTSNSANLAAIRINGGATVCNKCYIHDHTGSNGDGIINGSSLCLIDCIIESNGSNGIECNIAGGGFVTIVINCDIYNNGGDGIACDPVATTQDTVTLLVQNCNIVGNRGKAINMVLAGISGIVQNCGYGSGSQTNWISDKNRGLETLGQFAYPLNVTPWNSPATGDFSITLPNAKGVGRGVFPEIGAGKSGTVGYPDVGAAQSLAGTTVIDEGVGGVGGG